VSARDDVTMREVETRDGTIRLGQFLKLADLIDTGADAKPLLAEGGVTVNGEVETRRGRQLARGDVVSVAGVQVRVS
jgi:ribosome-associated protein